jgi:hypothetical protein
VRVVTEQSTWFLISFQVLSFWKCYSQSFVDGLGRDLIAVDFHGTNELDSVVFPIVGTNWQAEEWQGLDTPRTRLPLLRVALQTLYSSERTLP